MRSYLSASRERPVKAVAGVAAYLALVTLIVTLFTTSGFLAAVTGALTIGLLVGSYLLQRWARRRTVHATGHRSSPANPAGPASAPPPSEITGARMVKV